MRIESDCENRRPSQVTTCLAQKNESKEIWFCRGETVARPLNFADLWRG